MSRSDQSVPRGVRFAPLPRELLVNPELTLAAVRVWSHVWMETLGRPEWTLSYGQIGNAVGLNRYTVRDAVKWLERNGWMTCEARRDARGNQRPSLLRCIVATGCGSTDPQGVGEETPRGVGEETHHQESHFQESHYRENADASPLRGEGNARRAAEHLDADFARLTEILLSEGVIGDEREGYPIWRAMRRAGITAPSCWVEKVIDDGLNGMDLRDRLEDFIHEATRAFKVYDMSRGLQTGRAG